MDKIAPKYVRRQYLVAKKFQLKYVGLILLLMFLTAALCSYVVYYTSMMLLGEKLANVYPQGRLMSIVKLVNFRILLSILLITPLVALIGIFLSHRIAGPIYRMEKFLNNLALGDLTGRIVLRAKDELITLANGINFVVDSLKSNIVEQKAALSKSNLELANLKKAGDARPTDMASIKESANRLDEELKKIAKGIDRYKI